MMSCTADEPFSSTDKQSVDTENQANVSIVKALDSADKFFTMMGSKTTRGGRTVKEIRTKKRADKKWYADKRLLYHQL